MNSNALVSLAIGSLTTVVLAVALPYITSDLLAPDRVRVPWRAVMVALLLLALSAYGLRGWNPTPFQFAHALGFSAVMIGGIVVKWFMEVFAQKKFKMHETTLAQALLLAPSTMLLVGAPANSSHVFYWFLCGFFWCSVLCDLGRIFHKEEDAVRRVETSAL